MLATHSLSSLPPVLPVGLKRSMVLTRKEKEREKKRKRGGGGGGGVVLARIGFNRENVWMLKRKWVECWSISGEWWEHYWNLNGAWPNGGCEFWGNRRGIVWRTNGLPNRACWRIMRVILLDYLGHRVGPLAHWPQLDTNRSAAVLNQFQ